MKSTRQSSNENSLRLISKGIQETTTRAKATEKSISTQIKADSRMRGEIIIVKEGTNMRVEATMTTSSTRTLMIEISSISSQVKAEG